MSGGRMHDLGKFLIPPDQFGNRLGRFVGGAAAAGSAPRIPAADALVQILRPNADLARELVAAAADPSGSNTAIARAIPEVAGTRRRLSRAALELY